MKKVELKVEDKKLMWFNGIKWLVKSYYNSKEEAEKKKKQIDKIWKNQ